MKISAYHVFQIRMLQIQEIDSSTQGSIGRRLWEFSKKEKLIKCIREERTLRNGWKN